MPNRPENASLPHCSPPKTVESDAIYRLLFERNPLPMWVYDLSNLCMLAVNEAALKKYGYSRTEFLGLSVLDLHHDIDAAAVQAEFTQSPGELAVASPWPQRDRSGASLEVETETEALNFEGVPARLVLVRDVTEQRRADQAHFDLAYRLTSTLESIGDAFITVDRDWRFTYINAQAEQLMHIQARELLGCNAWSKFPEIKGTVYQQEFERAMDATSPVTFVLYSKRLQAWLEVRLFPSAQGLAAYFRDITQAHEAAERLQEEQEIRAAVVNSTSNGVIAIGDDGRISLFNPAAEHIFGYTSASMQGQSLEVLMPERFRAAHPRHRQQFAKEKAPTRMMGMGQVRGLRSDGAELSLEVTISHVTVKSRPMQIAVIKNVTERARANAVFEQSRAQLSELTQKLMTQEKTLVKRLAQTLHDQLGQTMAAVRMAHETILALQGTPVVAPIERLQQQLGMLIAQAIRQVRQVLVDLRPPLLDEQGLAAALDNELRNRSLTQPKMDISIHVPPEMGQMRWPSEVEYAAFMVVREAVENALRHSGASMVAVHLAGSPTALTLEVIDNGSGLGDDSAPKTGHLGMLGMQERAHAIAATVTVKSDEEHGTRITFSWQPF